MPHQSHSQITTISYVCLRLFYFQISRHTNDSQYLGYPENTRFNALLT